jgi:hypothetical protein
VRRRFGARRCWTRWALLATIPLLSSTGAATAGDGAASGAIFSFAETTTLATSCADLAKGVEVEVRNDTATARALHVLIGPVTDGEGKKRALADVCGGLSAKITGPTPTAGGNQTATVDPGASATVTLTGVRVPAPKASAAAPGNGSTTTATPSEQKKAKPAGSATQKSATFATTLVVFADEGLVSRRDVSVSEVKGAGVAAMPLADSRSVTHERYNPADDWKIWLPVKLGPGQAPALTTGQSVGVLTGEGGTTAVTYEGGAPRKLTKTSALLPLHIEPIGAGSYSGKLTLATGGMTTVTLTVKHWWLIAGLILAAGILIALVIQRYNGYWAPRGRLFERVNEIQTEKREAVDRLKQAAGSSTWKDFDLSGFDALARAARDEIDRKTKWRTVFQIDQKVIDTLNAELEALHGKVALLDKLTDAATALDAALQSLGDKTPSDLPPLHGSDRKRTAPALVPAARELENGTPLSAEDLKTRIDDLTTIGQTARTLHDDQDDLALYWSQANELERDLTDSVLRGKATQLKSDLEGVRHQLWTGDSANSLHARDSLDAARDKIADLWPSLPSPPELQHHAVGRRSYFAPEYITAPEEELEAGTVAPTLSDVAARKIIEGAALRQVAVIVASLAVALVTGITALYIGKPWGSAWDYVATFFWGLTTQAVITTLAGAVDGLGPLGALRFGVGAHSTPRAGS